MIVLAYGRPFWPLFLHVLGAMALFGSILATVILSVVAWRKPGLAFLRRATFWALVSGIPAYVVLRIGAQWIYSNEGFSGHDDPAWIGIGFAVSDAGLLLLLAAIGCAAWWQRAGTRLAGRIVAGLASLYLVLLAVAWLAMSGKWG